MPSFSPLAGSARTLLPASRPIGAIDPGEMASLTIRVRSKADPAALEALANKIGTQPIAERAYLTHDELEAQYGANPADLDAVEHYVQSHNLRTVRRSALERTIVVRGRLGDLLAAFHADLHMYDHASGQYRGRKGEISVPDSLAPIVTAIIGYDTRPKHRAPHRAKRTSLAGPGAGEGVAATVFAERYNFPKTAADGAALDGTGQTIAIIELGGGFQDSDLKVFFQEIGSAMPNVTAVSVDAATNAPSTPDSADGEVMLDIEVAGAVVPKANIVVYFAPNNGDKGFIDAISAAVNDTERKPSVVSISWGGPEDSTDQQGYQSFHEVFSSASALGVTICVASGDHGTADMEASQWDGAIHVDHPACDDLVLGCGGTQIDPASNADVVWNDGTPFDTSVAGGGGWAGGGGVSTIYAVPAYQANVGVPNSLATNKPGRGVPDIAMSATNYFTRVDTYEGASGGTSAVAPLMSALVARLNQAKGKNVGFLNPLLYANYPNGLTNDVTSGTNAITNTVQGYTAGPGWDACSGLGTPDGVKILASL